MSVSHPIFARLYQRLAPAMEEHGAAEHRRELLAGLDGRVVEVGAGTGLTFAHYPPSVRLVVAVEPEPTLRAAAAGAAEVASIPVALVAGLGQALPLGDDSVDGAVVSLVLCSVDQDVALAEIARVLRPGGELRFYEHVRAREPWLARFQRAADVAWPLLAGGCRTSRDTVAAIERAGFVIERVRRFRFPQMRLPVPASPHVLGVARSSSTPRYDASGGGGSNTSISV